MRLGSIGGIPITLSPEMDARLTKIKQQLNTIQQGVQMAATALDDLKTAVSGLNTSISAEIAAIQAKLAGFNGAVPAADAEAIVTQLGTLKSTIDTETAALTSPPA